MTKLKGNLPRGELIKLNRALYPQKKKHCQGCATTKTLDEFYFRLPEGSRRGGPTDYQNLCMLCAQEKSDEWIRNMPRRSKIKRRQYEKEYRREWRKRRREARERERSERGT